MTTTPPNVSIQPRYHTIDGISIRVAESDGRRDADALLLSPWPESVFAFEPTWSRLAEHAHLVAMDLPGFGQSERRDALMSPRAMGEFLIRAADAFGLEHPHVVGPDVGTAASLFAAALHPGRLRSVVLGTGAATYPLQLGEPLAGWVTAPDLEPYRRIDGREVVASALGTLERYAPSTAAREDYLASYAGPRFAESMRYVQSYPADLPVLEGLLPEIQTPVLIIAGARDTVVPPVNAELLHARLPRSRLALIDAPHFVWEDAADQYAALVTSWWTGGYATAGAAQAG